MTDDVGYLPRLERRSEFVDYLEGHPVFAAADIEHPDAGRKLVKTYMLETAGSNQQMPDLASRFAGRVHLHRLDDTLFRVEDAGHGGQVVGLIEELDERHPVFYTKMAVEHSDRWVRQTVDTSPWLDRLWLSSPILFELWRQVQATTPPQRYARLGFEHEARYEPIDGLDVGTEDDGADDADYETPHALAERRRSVVTLTESLSVLEAKLQRLIDSYDPLRSLVHLQMPAAGRGGHRLNYDGRATNRSDSFADHRATVRRVLALYRSVTEYAEARLWVDTTDAGHDGYKIRGSPLVIDFGEPLSEPLFNRFVELALERRTSRFRIGGFVTRRGPTKAHVVAVDRHLWQPFLLEATSQHLLAVLPHGTCGNTVHRLVTNVQRELAPTARAWLGSEPYEQAVADAAGIAA
ncbi:MAG: hypothetical protein OXL98_05690 [Acidimicrobiaceae bacterium]|nr:hypothetical protein [Acidimicrobiaceae bacterium]